MRRGKMRVEVFGTVFLLCLMLLIPCVALATPFTVNSVSYTNTANVYIQGFRTSNVTVYTEYTLNTDLYGSLDAFCIQNVDGPPNNQKYELVAVPSDLSKAAWLAQQWWSGKNTYGTSGTITKEDYQIAIWEVAFDANINLGADNFKYNSGANLDAINYLLALTFGSPTASVSVAHNPVGDWNEAGYQDFLVNVAVPEPARMLLMGAGLLAFAAFRRKIRKPL